MAEFPRAMINQALFDYQPVTVDGKSVLITGGTTGIGRATALLLVSLGAQVLLFGRHEKELNDALESIRRTGGEAVGLTADAAQPDDIHRVFEQVDKHFGGSLDILVNNAAVPFESIQKGRYSDWAYVVNTNLLGYMAMAHEAVERMKPSGSGRIVNIGSISADTRGPDSSVYVATKSGIQGFSESLAKEVNSLGIKVTLIEPGTVGTDFQSSAPPEKQRELEAQLKMLKAEDIAASVLYVLTQPQRCDVALLQVRPHLQED